MCLNYYSSNPFLHIFEAGWTFYLFLLIKEKGGQTRKEARQPRTKFQNFKG